MLSINITDTVSLTVLALSRRVLFSSIRGPPAETVTLCIFAKENTVELSLIFPMVYFSAAVLRLLTMVFMYHWRLYIFVSSRAITVEYMYGRWQYFSLLILLFVLFIFLIIVFFSILGTSAHSFVHRSWWSTFCTYVCYIVCKDLPRCFNAGGGVCMCERSVNI